MTAGAAAASPHDLNQESFMKIAVKNLSGLAAFRSRNLGNGIRS